MITVAQAEIRNLSATNSRSMLANQTYHFAKCLIMNGINGEPCWTRTSDPLLKRQMLYRLS